MPNYFSDYDTTVHFISEEEFDRDHTAMPHGGFVIRTGKTGKGENTDQLIEYSLKLGSNPEFTSSVLVAYARAAHRMASRGTDRLQDRFRCGSGLPFPVKRRGASRPSLIRSAKKDPFLDKRGSFFLPWNRVR